MNPKYNRGVYHHPLEDLAANAVEGPRDLDDFEWYDLEELDEDFDDDGMFYEDEWDYEGLDDGD